MPAMDARDQDYTTADRRREAAVFLQKHPSVLDLLCDSQMQTFVDTMGDQGLARIAFLVHNPWLDLERIIRIADSIVNISPDISQEELLQVLCRDTAMICQAHSATCRTYDPLRNSMIAAGQYNWDDERAEEIPYEDSLAGLTIKQNEHYCVPDISAEPLYREKEKILARGFNSMLALPVRLTDYDGARKIDVLVGTLQLYFKEKNKTFYPEQIKLLNSIVSRFNYVLSQQRKRELQKRSLVLQESRQALISILKRTESLDQVLSFLIARIAESINVKRCSLFSIEQSPGEEAVAVLIAGYPLDAFEHRYGVTLPFHQHPAFDEVCRLGVPLLITDARNDPRMRASLGLYLHHQIDNVYFVPIKDENNSVTNIIVLDADETHPLSNDDLFFCNALARDIELCIQVSIRSQERHDFFNQMLSFGAIAKVYAKRLSSPDTTAEELTMLYKKLYRSMLTVNDIITDRVPFARKEQFDIIELIAERLEGYYFPPQVEIVQNITVHDSTITADRKKAGRIIGNLLDNAHKKLEELRQGRLQIDVYAENEFIVIAIGNTGTIPDGAREKIFKERSGPLRPGLETGGQGLTIVKLFTVMHNGIAEFESRPESNWTVFRVKLPRE
ncbi:MAG: GAF domain-containing protein [Deltaproteobacteria bacterium]|nr:GAF domain-containing protein [Deltaproteobacteria bacterium]